MNLKKEQAIPLIGLGIGGLAGFAADRLSGVDALNVFERIGSGLRELSLAGGGGNMAAWGIVIAVSVLPLLLWRRKRGMENALLVLCGAQLFAMLFFLVNPGLHSPAAFLGEAAIARKGWGLIAGGSVLGTLLCWLGLRILRALPGRSPAMLPKLLAAAAGLYPGFLGFGAVRTVLTRVAAVAASNTGGAIVAKTTVLMGGLTVLELIPELLAGYVLLLAGDLAREVEAAPFEEKTVALAERIAARCIAIAKAAMLVTVAGNALQMAAYPEVAAVSVAASVPVMTLLLCAMLLVLCRYLRRAKAVSDDNASII